MSTERLYQRDALLLTHEAPVLAHATAGGRTGFVLASTCCAPEAGGQLADRGEVRWSGGAAKLHDAQEDEAGRIVHLLEGEALPALGAIVRVTLDEARRRQHMSQHTGQHVLSRALLDLAGAETISSRLGDGACTIDTPLQAIPEAKLIEAEEAVARLVLEDRPVHVRFPTAAELAAMPLRRGPKVEQGVRVIEVEGFDLSPCGGTHVTRTGQIGLLQVTGTERHKGGTRVHFRSGFAALRAARAEQRRVQELAQAFTCAPDGLPAAIERLRQDGKAATREAEALATRLGEALAPAAVAAAELHEGGRRSVVALGPAPFAAARALASAAVRGAPELLVIVTSDGPEGGRIVVERGAGSTVEAGALLRRLVGALGGKGGGRADRAEGSLPAGLAVEALLAVLR